MKNDYSLLTEGKIRELLKDILYKENNNKKGLNIYISGYIDNDNNLICPFLEEFDKAMKEEVKKLWKKD